MAEPEISPIQYPLDFPIKIMGRNEPGFTQKVVAIVRRHAPDFDPSTVETRPSRKNAYLSVTCVIRATSRAAARRAVCGAERGSGRGSGPVAAVTSGQ